MCSYPAVLLLLVPSGLRLSTHLPSSEGWTAELAVFSSNLSLKCALRKGGCRIGYEPTKMNRDHIWRSISRDTNVEVSALSPVGC